MAQEGQSQCHASFLRQHGATTSYYYKDPVTNGTGNNLTANILSAQNISYTKGKRTLIIGCQ